MRRISLFLLVLGLCMGQMCAPAPDSGSFIPPDDACQQGYSPATNAPETCCPDGLSYYYDGMCRATPPAVDTCPNDSQKTEPGVCGCGVPDTDSDHDGTPDCIDSGGGQGATVEEIQAATWLVVAVSNLSLMTGTAFAISDDRLATNAHVARGIEGVMGEPNGMVAVFQHETGLMREVLKTWAHPGYVPDSQGLLSADVGLLQVEGALPSHIPLPETLPALEVFDMVQLCGFPGDVVQGIDFMGLATTGEFHPRATCMRGTISSLRPFDPGVAATPENSQLIQYDLPVTPGTSGSAVLNESGQVIGVNFLRVGTGGDYTFAVRVDKLKELVSWAESGALPGTALSSLMPNYSCGTRYYEPRYSIGFDPPGGWFGPTEDLDSDDLFAVYFEAVVGYDYFAIWASVDTTIWTDPYYWIDYQIAYGAVLMVNEVFTTTAGDTAYFFMTQQPDGGFWLEAHVYRRGYDYQLFCPMGPEDPVSMYDAIKASMKTLCVGNTRGSAAHIRTEGTCVSTPQTVERLWSTQQARTERCRVRLNSAAAASGQ